MPEIDFKTGRYCGELVTFNGYLEIAFSWVFFVLDLPLFAYLCIFHSILIITSHRRLTISLKTRAFREYVWILGLKFGDRERFDTIDYIFIKENKVTETLRGRTYSNRLERDVYDAFIKFNGTTKVRLLRINGKKALLKKLRPIVLLLNTSVIDYSDGEGKKLDMNPDGERKITSAPPGKRNPNP